MQCGRAQYPSERGHSPHRITFPWRDIQWLGTVGGTCQIDVHMYGQTQGFPAECCEEPHTPSTSCCLSKVHPGAISSRGTQCPYAQPSTWYKWKWESLDQATFLHTSKVQLWCSHAHCSFGCSTPCCQIRFCRTLDLCWLVLMPADQEDPTNLPVSSGHNNLTLVKVAQVFNYFKFWEVWKATVQSNNVSLVLSH